MVAERRVDRTVVRKGSNETNITVLRRVLTDGFVSYIKREMSSTKLTKSSMARTNFKPVCMKFERYLNDILTL